MIIITVLVLLVEWINANNQVPPFSYSIDQSIPCPIGSGQDYLLARDLDVNTQSSEVQNILDDVPSFLKLQMKKLGSPSAGLVIVRNGQVILSSFQGRSNMTDAKSTLSLDSVFEIASITKTFTTATLFHMRDRGILPPQGLDTPVKTLLPNFTVQSPYASTRPITLRSLAMQVSVRFQNISLHLSN